MKNNKLLCTMHVMWYESHMINETLDSIQLAIENAEHDVEIWGSGNQMREFIYVDDVARACIHLMNNDFTGAYNCSSEVEITINDLANLIAEILGFNGKINYNIDKPEGHLRKGFTCNKLRSTGWKHVINLKDGIKLSYDWYKETINE